MPRATGLTRAAARRFLLTLVDLGYMRFDGKLFRLAPKVLNLGYAYLLSLSLAGIAEPHLEGLDGPGAAGRPRRQGSRGAPHRGPAPPSTSPRT